MNDPAANLDRLHGLALPSEVPWWPLAPGWYAVISLLLLTTLWIAWRLWRNWQSNAYRRAALRELASTQDITSIAEILRRTALAIAPREEIANNTGTTWLDWLDSQSPKPMPDTVRQQLTRGVYADPSSAQNDISNTRSYASQWITHHRRPLITDL